MLALVLVMLVCVALGAGVVGFVLVEARREGRGDFWTPEGEQLIAGARRTTGRVRARGEQLGRSAAVRTRTLAARRPERGAGRPARAVPADGPTRPARAADGDTGFRAAS